MVFLTLYKGAAIGEEKGQTRSLNSVEEAVQIGQESGLYYDIYNTTTGRMIDWNEINVKVDDGWYYDESELMWKKYSEGMSFAY